MVGTGAMPVHLIAAHCATRLIDHVLVWGRSAERAKDVARHFRSARFHIESVNNLEQACGSADIISCATLASNALIKGAWLKPGQHLDFGGLLYPLHARSR